MRESNVCRALAPKNHHHLASYLVKFLEFYNLEENVFQDVLGVPVLFIQLRCHTQNFTTFAYIKLKVVICAFF